MQRRYARTAQVVAQRAHAGQVDKTGVEYIAHPARVADRVRAHGGSEEAIAAAWLHDVLEDTSVTADDLRAAGIPEIVIEAVETVTRQSGESLEAYCARIRANDLAWLVKRADLEDNTDPRRASRLPPEDQHRLATKYARVRTLLGLTQSH